MIKKSVCVGPFDTLVFLEHPRKANFSYKAFLVLCTGRNHYCMQHMHDYIKDKTCIDRTIEHNTDCFYKEPIIESPVCEMESLKRTGIGDKS